jgi:hypothetical protein
MMTTHWRALVATPLIVLGCCSAAFAGGAVQGPKTAAAAPRPQINDVKGSTNTAGGLSCYGTLEGYLRCVDKKD